MQDFYCLPQDFFCPGRWAPSEAQVEDQVEDHVEPSAGLVEVQQHVQVDSVKDFEVASTQASATALAPCTSEPCISGYPPEP